MFDLTKINKVHFIGIGGIGVSAIAKMMLLSGKKVSGSDQSESQITTELAQAGATIFQGHQATNLPDDVDLVVYTIAISETNPELIKAKELNLALMSYPEVIGFISRQKKTIAVAGTHGKTTTTAMLAEIALSAGLDPTVVVGSILKNHRSNFIAGRGDLFIVEACEYRRSFLNLAPEILVITNIDEDHLDYYENLADIQNAFGDLVAKVPSSGFIICRPEDERIVPVLESAKARVIDYQEFNISHLKLKTPGEHNLLNAAAAGATAIVLKIKEAQIKESLSCFAGTWRRFEYKGKTKKGALVYDDYAHHPTEIKATLQAAKKLAGKKRVLVAFQPHLYSRTRLLFGDFIESLRLADFVIVAPIYAAREVDDQSVSSDDLVGAMTESGVKAVSVKTFEMIAEELVKQSGPDDIIITMGAGDIFEVATHLVV